MALIKRKTLRRAREMRGEMPDAEAILWSRLRVRVSGRKFRRQHPIGPYIADFACTALRLIVEVDGPSHGTAEQRAHDARRAGYLRRAGWHVVRFTNDDVYKHLNSVLETIERFACGEIPRDEALSVSPLCGEPPLPCALRTGEERR